MGRPQASRGSDVLSTAADLWLSWVRAGVLRPQDYDSDVADLVRRRIVGRETKGGPPIENLLDLTSWGPRELIHAIAPAVASFVGMHKDLLALYTRIGAASGTGDNLRVQYEFAEGDWLDESLGAFRETSEQLMSFATRMRPLAFSLDRAFSGPKPPTPRSMHDVAGLDPSADLSLWRLDSGVEPPTPTGNERFDELIGRYHDVIQMALQLLAGIGQNTREVREWLWGLERPSGSVREALAQAATDYWPLWAAGSMHGFCDTVQSGDLVPDARLLDQLDAWLAEFWGAEVDVTIEQTVRELTDILSMPTWGRRHELDSAWVLAQIDEALLKSRLNFVVVRGALRLPFRATLLAHLDPPGGEVELWCELRSEANGLSGRVGAIQPDYRFVRRTAGREFTVAAIEVKQYLQAATKNPGDALRDYAHGLPEAQVLLVAHGPLGADVRARVREEDRDRTSLFPHVRPGRPWEQARFRGVIASILRHSGMPSRIELRWSATVHDLDLHLSGSKEELSWKRLSAEFATLAADAFDGGPEIADVNPGGAEPLLLRVHQYSREGGSILESHPVVTITWEDGAHLSLRPQAADPGEQRWWSVATLCPTGVEPLSSTVV